MINKTGMPVKFPLHPRSLNVRPTLSGRSPALPDTLTACKVTKYFSDLQKNSGEKWEVPP